MRWKLPATVGWKGPVNAYELIGEELAPDVLDVRSHGNIKSFSSMHVDQVEGWLASISQAPKHSRSY